jgi:serine protease Do
MVDASVSYGASGGGVFEAATGALIGVVESYRTARMTVPTTPEKVLDIPVAGETTLVSSAAIVRFLSASGLELPRPAVRDTGARAPVSTLSTPR